MKKKEIIAQLKNDIEELAAMNRILTHTRDGLLIVTEDNKIDADRKDKEISDLRNGIEFISYCNNTQRDTIEKLEEELELEKLNNKRLNKYYEGKVKCPYTKIEELNTRLSNQEETIKTLKGELALKEMEIKKLKSYIFESGTQFKNCNQSESGKILVLQSEKDKEIEKLKSENKELKEKQFCDIFVNSFKNGSRFIEGLNKGLRIGYGIDNLDEKDDWYYYISTFQRNFAKKPENKSFWRIFK
jgi:uncharacterized coiled-coil protein SlyX